MKLWTAAAFFASTSAVYRRPPGSMVMILRERADGDGIRMRARNRVIEDADELRVADAAQRDAALAVLHGLFGVEARQRARGLRDRAEALRDPAERLVRIELAGDDEHGVVRLVVRAVERLQPAEMSTPSTSERAPIVSLP